MLLCKIDLLLCIAFQHSYGPFFVSVKFSDVNDIENFYMTKDEIKNISLWDEVERISITNVEIEKRWRTRTI